MKLLNILFLVIVGILPGSDISTANQHKKLALEAFKANDFSTAIQHYSILVDSLGQTDDGLMLNLGNAYYARSMELNEIFKADRSQLNKKELAELFTTSEKSMKCYEKLSKSPDADIRAKANNQAGVIALKLGDAKTAEGMFKEALKANPYDENIRYNYELAKKLNKEKEEEKKKEDEKKEEQKDKEEEKEDEKNKEEKDKEEKKEDKQSKKEDTDKEDGKPEKEENKSNEKSNKDGGDKDDKGKDGKSGGANEENEKESDGKPASSELKKRLKEMNMSKERAKMILEAIKNQETQYYQQMIKGKRKPNNPNKPKW